MQVEPGRHVMDRRLEEQLVALESVDLVASWHQRIFARQLNSRRANEIASSARQAREYFRNAASAAHSVRPLLSYYGNSALARSAVLLLRPNAGEESLTQGHGLKTVGWAAMLTAAMPQSLSGMGGLKIRMTDGLFQELIASTENRICLHTRSSNVDWSLDYPGPTSGCELTLMDIASRLPDLTRSLGGEVTSTPSLSMVHEIAFDISSGFRAMAYRNAASTIPDAYRAAGYKVADVGNFFELTCTADGTQQAMPQFSHRYIEKMFGSIPSLYLTTPFPKEVRLSQIAVTFALSYVLGMLTRYFPTHWIAVQSGSKGDELWPMLFAAQRYVEQAFPELILEYLEHRLAKTAST